MDKPRRCWIVARKCTQRERARERERQRETETETERETKRETKRERAAPYTSCVCYRDFGSHTEGFTYKPFIEC